jgi:large subunit ribosomal protein L24e
MVKQRKCSFCQYDIPIGRGFMYVKKDGTILNFCTRKCKNALFRGSNPRKTRWTALYGKQ